MQVVPLELEGAFLVNSEVHLDSRGFFAEIYRRSAAESGGFPADFIQENIALSEKPLTVRGLHFQIPPCSQAKLVCVVSGAIFDVIVDLRAGAPTFGRHLSIKLSADTPRQLFVPEGFAHGYCTLRPHTRVLYKTTSYYSPEHERGLLWSDPALQIAWPTDGADIVISEADQQQPALADLPVYFQQLETDSTRHRDQL